MCIIKTSKVIRRDEMEEFKLSNDEIEKLNGIMRSEILIKYRIAARRGSGYRESSIARNIKFYRGLRRLSQVELAEKVGVDRTTVINWERGSSCPDAWKIEDLAKIFGVEVQELHTKRILYRVAGDDEEMFYINREKEWNEKNPNSLYNREIKGGRLELWEGDFYRDYVWITRGDLEIIAAELVERGFCVTDLNLYDGLEACDEVYPLVVHLKKNQVSTFKKAVSEILVDFANHVSRFQNVVEFRGHHDLGEWGFNAEQAETVKNPYNEYVVIRGAEQSTDGEEYCFGDDKLWEKTGIIYYGFNVASEEAAEAIKRAGVKTILLQWPFVDDVRVVNIDLE